MIPKFLISNWLGRAWSVKVAQPKLLFEGNHFVIFPRLLFEFISEFQEIFPMVPKFKDSIFF